MKAKNVFSMVGLAVVCGAAASVHAKPDVEAQRLDWNGQIHTPVRMGVINADGSFGGWIDVDQTERGVACNTASAPIYDAFQPDVGGADQDTPVGADTAGCAGVFGGGTAPSSRWYFGSAYTQWYYGLDFNSAAGGGSEIDHTTVAMNFFGTGDTSASSPVFLIMQLFEDMDTECGAFPPNTGFTGGVILEYAPIAQGPGGYNILTADICGLGWNMNADGEGGLEIIFAAAFDSAGGTYTPFTTDPGSDFFGIQGMLWGTNADGTGSGLPGAQESVQYDDDGGDASTACNNGLLDGAICPAECYDYAAVVGCPDPLSAMFVLWGQGDPCADTIADINGDGAVNGVDIGLFLSSYSTERNEPAGTCVGCVADMNGDNTVNGVDVGLFLSEYSACRD